MTSSVLELRKKMEQKRMELLQQQQNPNHQQQSTSGVGDESEVQLSLSNPATAAISVSSSPSLAAAPVSSITSPPPLSPSQLAEPKATVGNARCDSPPLVVTAAEPSTHAASAQPSEAPPLPPPTEEDERLMAERFSCPPTAVLRYHSASSTSARRGAADVVSNFFNSSVFTAMVKRRAAREEEERTKNDISISRKKSRKETADISAHTVPHTNDGVASGAAHGSIELGAPRPPCRSVEVYKPDGRLSEGVYGVVFRGIANKAVYALKQVKAQWLSESQVGFPAYLLREIDLTMRIKHPNVISTREVVFSRTHPQQPQSSSVASSSLPNSSSSDTAAAAAAAAASKIVQPTYGVSIYSVMDYAWRDLKSYLYERKSSPYLHLSRRNIHPDATSTYIAKIKCIAKQLFTGLAFLHEHRILHRDLKTSNVLMTSDGTARICDLGLARFARRFEQLTPTVVTLMYRAPELHFGISDYDTALDVWSAGCILAELFLKAPLFRAENELEHCARVCDIIGYPTNESFEGLFMKQEAVAMLSTIERNSRVATGGTRSNASAPYRTESRLAEQFHSDACTTYMGAKSITPQCLDLLSQIFQWNPRFRPSAAEVLQHPFFTSESPAAADPALLVKAMPMEIAAAEAPSPASPHLNADAAAAEAAAAALRLEEEEQREQEAQAQGVRDTSPEEAAKNRAMAVFDNESQVPTPRLLAEDDDMEVL